MSAGQLTRQRSVSSRGSKRTEESALAPPPPSVTPKPDDRGFDPCAATASHFLYAHRNVILCLHHDSLAIDRRFDRHREDVVWIAADNVSERGMGRLVVSYDVGQTAIVWDLRTGEEVARFASYEDIRVAVWLRNGNVAFGNSQGNVILFEPSTSEHISARTIFDPITALAPSSDCRTFAIGYSNGSILIATLQPSFTILHTLNTSRAPSPISGLAWHGSSSKQKSDMLATQTADGDLRVWSVPKAPHNETPMIIRVLNRSDTRDPGQCWFGWSKNGRIVQNSDSQTCAWDVRTKKVTYEIVPTIDGITAIANYGPTATLFTLGRNHTVQQYDLNPNGAPMLVANVQHVPANAPPSPPNSIEEQKGQQAKKEGETRPESSTGPSLPVYLETESSEGEGNTMSPLEKIAQEMDQMEEERRDRVGPLSPVSSKSSTSSRSSTSGRRRYRLPKASPSALSGSNLSDGTTFSMGSSSARSGRDSLSIHSQSSFASSKYKTSALRQEVLRSPEGARQTAAMDLFPFIKTRLGEVPFRAPQYDQQHTPDDLRQQMLSVVFGWNDDIEALIRDELAHHPPGSASGVLLSKWLGELGADLMASMIGSESMTSSDWMLLALSTMGQDSQKKVGQAFVQRLLEKGDIHPAVAILLGLGERNDAIEVYVSRKYYMEAVLLTCLTYPTDWQRQSYLVRKWGEAAVSQRQPELAVRCFSCTSMESSEPWRSPGAQDAIYAAQKQALNAQLSPPLSPPTSGIPSRVKNSSLTLITSFGDRNAPRMMSAGDEPTPVNAVGVTPIADSALSPGGAGPWLRPSGRTSRDPSSARTATPGGYRSRRIPSVPDTKRNKRANDTPLPESATHLQPATAIELTSRNKEIPLRRPRGTSQASNKTSESLTLSAVAYDPSQSSAARPTALPSPAHDAFSALKQESRIRNGSRDRKPGGLQLEVHETVATDDLPSSRPGSGRHPGSELSPPLTGASVRTDGSLKSAKIRSIDQYISSLEEANFYAKEQQQRRAPSRPRGESREGRAGHKSGLREPSESRGRSVRYIKPAKRSPSSPVPMSPDEAAMIRNEESYEDERYYKLVSPTDSKQSRGRSRSNVRTGTSKVRSGSKTSHRAESPEKRQGTRARSRATNKGSSRTASRQASPDAHVSTEGRGSNELANDGSSRRSPSSPTSMSPQALFSKDEEDGVKDESVTAQASARPRQRSTSRRRLKVDSAVRRDPSSHDPSSPQSTRSELPKLPATLRQARSMSRKELAARELEERRLSLARRPSAPVIPLPGQLAAERPSLGARSVTELGNSPSSTLPPYSMTSDRISRSQSADPESMMRPGPRTTSGTSTTSVPIGLPATPRAMRHPRYMTADPSEQDDVPAVPQIPSNIDHGGAQPSHVGAHGGDDIGPLLPSTVYGQKAPQSPPRAASAPPENGPAFRSSHASRGSTGGRGHTRNGSQSDAVARPSPPPITASIDQTISGENQVVVVGDPSAPTDAPPLLAELQHLAGPPPPPPPPTMFQQPHSSKASLGVINIAIDEEAQATSPGGEAASYPAPSTSPHAHRRGRGSVSENIGSRLRNARDRMRSTSRSRNKSPPVETFATSPYETILPPIPFVRRDSASNVRSPNGDLRPMTFDNMSPPPPPPPPSAGGPTVMEQVVSPGQQNKNTGFGGYRHPKEVRANMPPEQLQQGVGRPAESGMI